MSKGIFVTFDVNRFRMKKVKTGLALNVATSSLCIPVKAQKYADTIERCS